MDPEFTKIATLVTVFGALLTAVYTSPKEMPYCAWDLLLSAAIISFCLHFRTDLQDNWLFLNLSRVAFSIAGMLATMAMLQALVPSLVKSIYNLNERVQDKLIVGILDVQFLITIGLFVSTLIWY